jgi:signal transduction histidine kinase
MSSTDSVEAAVAASAPPPRPAVSEFVATLVRPLPVALPTALGLIVAISGVLVLIGWATGIEALRSLMPGFIVTIPNTATAFIAGGAALVLLRSDAVPAGQRRAGMACAALALLIGGLTFLERMFGFDFGIDLLLFADAVRAYPYLPPGQMATNTTLGFILAGAALLVLAHEPGRHTRLRELLATAGIVIAALALLGHLFGAPLLYAIDLHTGMAPLTAICFALLHGGILLARPDRGGAALLTGSDAAATLVRRLLAVTVAVPVLTGWLWLRGREANLFSREGGITLLTIASIVMLVSVVMQSGRALRRSDRQREALLVRERELRAAAEAERVIAEHASREAEAASRVKSEFLATMSHELRTPLNAIIGYAGLMREGVGGQLLPLHRDHVSRIDLSAQHLLALINDVLSLARLDAGGEEAVLRETDIAALVQECGAMTEPLFLKSGLRFSVDAAAGPAIMTDPDRVRQIVLNMLSNAAKFTASGGVTLRLERNDDRGVVLISVRDTGPGIEIDYHDRIFDAFWQVDMNTTRRHGGTGLGLSVSRQLARMLGGDIHVVSSPGEGSTFTLELPVAIAAETPSAPDTAG